VVYISVEGADEQSQARGKLREGTRRAWPKVEGPSIEYYFFGGSAGGSEKIGNV
jgi:hypothetical protein